MDSDDHDGLESVLSDDDEFQEAALFVQNNLSFFSRDDLLYLYGRFKQVSTRRCQSNRYAHQRVVFSSRLAM
jgi:hypothetical protein